MTFLTIAIVGLFVYVYYGLEFLHKRIVQEGARPKIRMLVHMAMTGGAGKSIALKRAFDMHVVPLEGQQVSDFVVERVTLTPGGNFDVEAWARTQTFEPKDYEDFKESLLKSGWTVST